MFKCLWIKGLFFEEDNQVNSSFRIFNQNDCIRNFMHPQGFETDFSHYKFWKHVCDNYYFEKESVDIKKKVETYLNRDYWSWTGDFASGINSELQDNLLESLTPKSIRVSPFIKEFGAFKINRSAIPFIQRTKIYRELLKTFDPLTYGGILACHGLENFGTFHVGKQSRMHFPFSVNSKNKIQIICNNVINKICVDNVTFFLKIKSRIHLYPYGLVIPQILISITSNTEYSLDEQIKLNRIIWGKDDSIKTMFRYKDKIFSSLKNLLNYITDMCNISISSSENSNSSEMFCLQTLRTLNSENDNVEEKKLQILKILKTDSIDTNYSSNFINKHDSIFSKNESDFFFISGGNAVTSMESWLYSLKRTNKYKSRISIRYYWSMIYIFQFIVSSKFIISKLNNYLQYKPLPNTDSLERIHAYYRFVNNQPKSLNNSGFRLLYYQISNKIGLDRETSNLIEQIKTVKDIPNVSDTLFYLDKSISFKGVEEAKKMLEKLISSNKIAECFDILKREIKYKEFYKDIILLESQWNSIEGDERLGRIKYEDVYYLSNRIKRALLNYI